MCRVKSVHPALIDIWPPNNADRAAHMPSPRNQLGQSLNLETSWARDDGWPLPKNKITARLAEPLFYLCRA
ncbi:hypothetical protein DPMN_173360 [Dreissena polymorpha]|uniref:Uncharacterized protein n=1 Tax=Dreissena polymorpha TaxID=45954 RepID=A0A9D4E1F5_DREPO|nr:hypothetical protein DPMN_173360 [Dreissena polymorpha]